MLPIRQEAERLTEEAAYELSVLRQAVNSRDTGAGLRVLLGKVRETESDCRCYPPRSSCFLWKQARPLHRACLHPTHGCGCAGSCAVHAGDETRAAGRAPPALLGQGKGTHGCENLICRLRHVASGMRHEPGDLQLHVCGHRSLGRAAGRGHILKVSGGTEAGERAVRYPDLPLATSGPSGCCLKAGGYEHKHT